jgi:hypothetical protein
MAHFAQLDENNKVINIVVVNNQELINDEGNESENKGITFCQDLFGTNTTWVQTSYNGNIRKCYAQIGGYYDKSINAFIPLKPFDSWKFNFDSHSWQAPVEAPKRIEGYTWVWFEGNKEWVKIQVPTE